MRTCKAKNCNKKFDPRGTTQIVCSIECAREYQLHLQLKKKHQEGVDRRRKIKVMKEKIKTLSDHKKELQVLVNKYVQIRDKGKDCVSCDKPDTGEKRDAGHFWSQGGNPSVRFDLDNIHVQCVRCNRDLHGNLLEYRPRLIKRIGTGRFYMLGQLRTCTVKYTIPEIKDLKQLYKTKIRELKS